MTDFHYTGLLRHRWIKRLAWFFVATFFVVLAGSAIALLLDFFSD